MGACLSKPAPEGAPVAKAAVEQSNPASAVVPEARQALAAAELTPPIDILPAPPSVAPSVAILPPWVSHNDTNDMNKRASSSAAVSTASASNPAANALRSNLSEVRWQGRRDASLCWACR